MSLTCKEWTFVANKDLANRIGAGVSWCNYQQCRWGLMPNYSSDCEADIQTMEHVVNKCHKRSFREGWCTVPTVLASVGFFVAAMGNNAIIVFY